MRKDVRLPLLIGAGQKIRKKSTCIRRKDGYFLCRKAGRYAKDWRNKTKLRKQDSPTSDIGRSTAGAAKHAPAMQT